MKQSNAAYEELKIVPKEDNAQLKKQLFRMIGAWPIFVLSLLICLSLAYLYIRSAPPVYQAVASIMVKDENKGADLLYNKALEEIGLGVNTKLVENEMELLKSYDLLASVVDTLQLFVSVNNADKLKEISVFESDLSFSIQILNPWDIKKKRKWIVVDSAHVLKFEAEEDNQTTQIEYGKVYKVNGIRFRFDQPETYNSSLLVNAKKATHKYKISIKPVEETIIEYSKNLEVEPASKVATVINLRIKDTNKERAAAILQSLILKFKRQGIENKNIVLDNTINFLNDRLDTVAKGLRSVENSVEKFKSDNRVTELSSDAEQYLAISKQVDEQKAAIQTQLSIIKALETDILQNQDNPKIVPTTFGIQDPSLGLLIEKHNDLVLQNERLEQKSGPKNPLLLEQQDQIKELRGRLLTNVHNLKQAYTISLNNISAKDQQMITKIRDVPQLEKRLLQITRNQNVQEQLYAFLLQKREEAAFSRLSNIEDSKIIVKARGLDPISPKKQIIWIVAVLIGLLLPIAIISLKDFLDNKVGDIQQIQQKTSLPLLGTLSHVKKLKHPIIVKMRSRSAVAEQIRNIRTAINYSAKTENVKIILVTSFQSGDGKSFVSLNLAAGYALLNKKTVIVEFDLRRPSISAALGIETPVGISSILSGNAHYEDVLVMLRGFYNKLYLLPAGELPTNPAELISGSRMEFLIKDLVKNFDYIIIDTPPFSLVSDATLLQQYADKTLIVLRQDYTSRQVYPELTRWINGHADNNSTYVVLNDAGKTKRYQEANGYVYDKKYYHDEDNL
ncbi:MAG: polysaccharide biosynthesis tyrosine autokinase [Chitinophagaceae bacterium]